MSDIFENFRDLCLKTYELNPCYYYTAPSMSFDCMLKRTGVELEQMHDYDMILMMESGIRGWLTQAAKRYSKANNFSVVSQYIPTEHDTWIVYLDVTNLSVNINNYFILLLKNNICRRMGLDG